MPIVAYKSNGDGEHAGGYELCVSSSYKNVIDHTIELLHHSLGHKSIGSGRFPVSIELYNWTLINWMNLEEKKKFDVHCRLHTEETICHVSCTST